MGTAAMIPVLTSRVLSAGLISFKSSGNALTVTVTPGLPENGADTDCELPGFISMSVEKNGFSPFSPALTRTFAAGAGATPGGSFLVTCALIAPFAKDADTLMSTLV
jgi:hypothetical protein